MTLRLEVDGCGVHPGAGETLFAAAERAGVTVPTSCRKQGKCRECLLEVEEGGDLLSPLAEQERHLEGAYRLACRTTVREGATGTVRCRTLRRGALQIETGTGELSLPPWPLEPAVTREGERVFLDGAIAGVSTGPLLGLALDLGTTTIALRLYDLERGALLGTRAFENPQRFGGSDVMARIRYDAEHPGRLLQRTLIGYLRQAVASLAVDPDTIWEVVVAGNPTMRDLFFGLDVQGLGRLPYRSASEAAWRGGFAHGTTLVDSGADLRLPMRREGRVYGLPLIASHVGADAAAALLAVGLFEGPELRALMDIGTNTEVLLGNGERILAASCPAGPAFEGGGLRAGMPALEGAIERIRLGPDGVVEMRVIGGGDPVGICGSGLVDLLAELRRTGRMNAQGRLEEGNFVIDPAGRLHLDEHDVSVLAQAKGAHAAGLRILADAWGVPPDRVERWYLAGGFSRSLDLDAARRIGLIPDVPDERFTRVGNAALEGASIALRSGRARAALEKAVQRVELVRLEAHPRFFDCFVEGCQFEPFGAGVPA